MALTLHRWLALAVAGMLVIAGSVFSRPSKPPRVEDRREQLTRATRLASNAATRASDRLRALIVRDSVRAAVARMGTSNESRTIMSPSVAPEIAKYDRVLGVRLDLARAVQRTQPIDIVFAMDTLSTLRSATLNRSFVGVTHVLPSAPGERCMSIVRHAPKTIFWNNYQRYWTTFVTGIRVASRVLGPCAFYEAFGPPGRGVDEWLANGAWRFGASGALRNFPGEQVFREYYWMEPLWGRNAGWPLRHYVTTLGYRCAAGDADVCRSLVLDPNSDPQAWTTPRMTQDRIVPLSDPTNAYDPRYMSIGPRESQLLADVANDIGPERFKQFWASDQPPAEAFKAATGRDIGAWTAEWARARYGVNRMGPALDANGILWSGLLALGALAAALATTRRRQIT